MLISLTLATVVALTNCGSHEAIVAFLQYKYQEVIISYAIHKNGGIMEEVVNRETGTWSTILTMPMQATCIVAFGDGWRAVIPKEILGEKDA